MNNEQLSKVYITKFNELDKSYDLKRIAKILQNEKQGFLFRLTGQVGVWQYKTKFMGNFMAENLDTQIQMMIREI